jgi:hypothetical protein
MLLKPQNLFFKPHCGKTITTICASFFYLHINTNAGLKFTATIEKYLKPDDKYGWTYIIVPAEVAGKLNPGVKKSYRVKGKLDDYEFSGVSLLPVGEGAFMLALNATIRKGIGKGQGAVLQVSMTLDTKEYELDADLTACLADEPIASAAFYKMPRSHQNYYSKWIESAKTEATKVKRIALAIDALLNGLDYGAMLRKARDDNREMGR